MSFAALDRALTEPWEPALRRLPDRADGLLRELDAPPRLAAHLRAVHDVAHRLLDWLGEEHPELVIDRTSVLFGAATHDIGKIIHTRELSEPGSTHEEADYQLLLDHRTDPAMARFARTHADWTTPGIVIEDLVVSLADKIWKAKRVPDLEQMITGHLATASRRQPWEAFMVLDDFLTRLAEEADHRLAFQTRHPITP
ncbi:MAG: HD domain-containing protein [Actinoallomurus sp.]